jgi:hypothetical protein
MAIDADEQQAGTRAILSIAETDASGRYRLENVPAGRYYIGAGLVDLPSYYPGADKPSEAGIVTVTPGLTVEGFDFTLVAPFALRVSGRLVRANSGPVRVGPGHEVRLSMAAGQSLTARVADDGTFEFRNVLPGVYSLRARAPLTTSTVQVVVADRDVANAEVLLTPIKTVNGRVVVDGGGPVPRFALDALDPPTSPGGVAAPVKVMISTDRSFTLFLALGEQPLAVSPGSLPEGYSVKALKYGRVDLLKEPLRVEMSDTAELVVSLQSPRRRRVQVSGRVVPYDASLPTAVVKLDSPAFAESNTALVREDGSFQISDVMPGRYTLTSTFSGASTPAVIVGDSNVEGVDIILPTPVLADTESVVGSLSWIIYEAFSGAVVDRGGGPVRIKDVSIRESGQGPDLRTQKVIALNDRFSVAMAERVTEWKAGKTNLTFTVRHSDYQTLSYESFRIESPTRAARPQKPGELGIELSEVAPRRWEVTRTEFLTDISIDVSHSAMIPRGSPYWRVVILKGSNIAWPSLINGKTIAN